MKEVLVKARMTLAKAKETFGPHWAKVEAGELLFMPIVHPRNDAAKGDNGMFAEYLAAVPRSASMYEMCFDDPADVPAAVEVIKAAPGAPRIWVNTLWDSLSAKHSDRAALLDPAANWGWWLDNGVTMIQSDYAAELIVWLTQKGRRNF